MQKKKIVYYDSMAGRGTRFLNLSWQWLQEEHKDKKNGECLPNSNEWEMISTGSHGIPQQHNGCDCGVFTCMFFDYLEADRPFNDGFFHQKNMNLCRKRIAIALLNNKAPDQVYNTQE